MDVLRHCSLLELEKVAETVFITRIAKGQTIAAQGAPATTLFVVRSGVVNLRQDFGSWPFGENPLRKVQIEDAVSQRTAQSIERHDPLKDYDPYTAVKPSKIKVLTGVVCGQ